MSERIWGKGRAVVYSFLNRDPASNRVVVEVARPGPDDRILVAHRFRQMNTYWIYTKYV